MAYALVRGMEVTIAALAQSFSQAIGVYGGETDDSIVRRAWQYLADAGFADEADSAWAFAPGAVQSLWGQDRFASKDFQSGVSAVENAKLTPQYGSPAYRSNLLRSPASGQHDNMFLNKSAVILVAQVKPTPKAQYRIEYNADAMLLFDLYAAVEAEQPTETPTTAAAGAGSSELEALGDSAAVLIRGQ
jgi:hypothetical protein